MNDLEITRLCADAMGGTVEHELPRGNKSVGWIRLNKRIFSPLHDDAQAMALVKKFNIGWDKEKDGDWHIALRHEGIITFSHNKDLNRAICECVARMQEGAKK